MATMKQCCTCRLEKEFSEFNKNRKKKDGLQDRCRPCDNAANRAWYQENKLRTKERVDRNNARYQERGKAFLCEYLAAHPCVDCGEGDIVVLEFDHLRDKLYNIGDLIQRAGSLARIEKEILKCDVVCANCHRRRTAKRGRFYRMLGQFESSSGHNNTEVNV